MHRVSVKHGIRTHGRNIRAIAVVAMVTAAAISGSCLFGTATNLCEQSGRRCNPGQTCAANQDICIEIGGCGDGIVNRDKGEICDDGNILDGEIINSVFIPDSCNHDCTSNQKCGNNVIDAGETCDDGNRNGLADDGCDTNCQLKSEFCGNGVTDKDMEEQCDPGGIDSENCNSNAANNPANLMNLDPTLRFGCKFSKCGDGYTNIAAMEQCDSGDMITADCNGPLCTKPFCGDNFHNGSAGEDCDNGDVDTQGCNGNNKGNNGPGSCKFPSCGDRYVNMSFKPAGSSLTELCDTGSDSSTCNGSGNNDSKNNSDAQCQPPKCGDGYINTSFIPLNGATDPENCDNNGGVDTSGCNGNRSGNDGPGSCRVPACGDKYVNTNSKPSGSTLTETCDTGGDSSICNGDGNNNNNNNNNAKCQAPQCGDHYTNGAFVPPDAGAGMFENCDNGSANTRGCNGNNNGNNGPGSCRIPSCGDGYVNNLFIPLNATSPEQCDNGAANSDTTPDACRTNCQNHFCGDGVKDSSEACDKGDGAGKPQTCAGTLTCKDDCSACK